MMLGGKNGIYHAEKALALQMSSLKQLSESGMAEAEPLGGAAGPGNLNSPTPQQLQVRTKFCDKVE